MVDKKLSEFSQITPAEIAKLICLYLDENNAIKNGVVDFAALDALLAHKAGNETFTGNKTFSGETVFSGNATFNNTVNANISGNAPKDGDGNTISSTYAKLAGNNTFSGANTFSGNTVFSGATYLPAGVTILKQDSDLEGGEIHFSSGDNEPNAGKSTIIDRYNGQLRFFGTTSGGSVVSFSIDMQNDTVYATPGITSAFAWWSMPNYAGGCEVPNGFTTPSNGWIRIYTLEGRSGNLYFNGAQVWNQNWQGGDFGKLYMHHYIPVQKNTYVTFDGNVMQGVAFFPCVGG